MNNKYIVLGAVIAVLAVAGYFYFYYTPFSFSDNGGTSLEDAIIISGPNSSDAKTVIDKGIGKYLANKYKNEKDFGIRGISDFIAYNGRRYIRILEESGYPPNKYFIFYSDVTDILGNKAKAYQDPIHGGDGSSLDIPVVLSAAMANDLDAASDFMLQHIADLYGIFGEDWQYISDSAFKGDPEILGQSRRVFKQVNIKLSDDSETAVYFNITAISK